MPFLVLPNELIFQICSNLPPPDVNSLLRTNRYLSTILPASLITSVLSTSTHHFRLKLLYYIAGISDLEKLKHLISLGLLEDCPPDFLHEAVVDQSDDVIRTLLATDIPCNTKDINHLTPLCVAAREGRKNVVRMLLRRKDVEVNGRSHPENPLTCDAPLYQAVRGKHHFVIRQLLEHPKIELVSLGRDNTSPLCQAVAVGDEISLRILLTDGRLDVNHGYDAARSPLGIAVSNGTVEMVRILLSDAKINLRRFGSSNYLIDNFRYNSILRHALASQYPNAEIIEQLINHPQMTIYPLVMHHAVRRHDGPHLPTLELLLRDERVQVNFGLGGTWDAPLFMMWNALMSYYDPATLALHAALRLMIKCERVDVNKPDIRGNTLLVLAVEAGRVDKVKLLLERKDLIVEEEKLISREQAKERGGYMEEIWECLAEFLEERRRDAKSEETGL